MYTWKVTKMQKQLLSDIKTGGKVSVLRLFCFLLLGACALDLITY
jgi:hypothetical protein